MTARKAKEFVAAALFMSEAFDTPVMLRMTTRIAHSQSMVGTRLIPVKHELKEYVKNPTKFVMIPAMPGRNT